MRELEMFKNVFGEGYDKTLDCMETHCDEKRVKKMQNDLDKLRKLIDKLEKNPNPYGLVNRERRQRQLVKMVELVESILKSSLNKRLMDCKLDKCRKEYIEQSINASKPVLQKGKETKKNLNKHRRLMAKYIAKNKSKKRMNGGACTPENEGCIMQLTPKAGPQMPRSGRRTPRRGRRPPRRPRLSAKARGVRATLTPQR